MCMWVNRVLLMSAEIVYKLARTRAPSFRHVDLYTETRMRIAYFTVPFLIIKASVGFYLAKILWDLLSWAQSKRRKVSLRNAKIADFSKMPWLSILTFQSILSELHFLGTHPRYTSTILLLVDSADPRSVQATT